MSQQLQSVLKSQESPSELPVFSLCETPHWALMAHAFNASTLDAEAGRPW